MDSFFEFLKIVFIGLFALIALFLILLALPKSKIRSMVLEIMGYGGAAASAVSIVSPIDPIPDFIPVLGQMDDIVAFIFGIISLIMAIHQGKQRKKFGEQELEAKTIINK